MKRLIFLLLVLSLVYCEVEPSGKAAPRKSETPERHPEKPTNKIDTMVPVELVVQEKVLPPPPPIEIPEIEEIPVPVEEIIDFPSIEASFPGGSRALIEFMNDRLDYPEIALEMEEEGTVFIRFTIERDGSVTRVQVIKSANDVLDREAKRVVRRMPRWIPAEENGRRAVSEHTLPIAFEL